jgi:signal transduction histidine kinase
VKARLGLTVRARLTLLYSLLFGLGGAVIVAVSYALVAQEKPAGQQLRSPGGGLASIVSQCKDKYAGPTPNKPLIAQCVQSLEQQQGARHQQSLILSHLLEYSLIALVVVILVSALLGWIAAGRALRPVHRITAAARAASEHNLSARVAADGPRDELRELAETFDAMLSRLESAFESQRRFIANASHELRTPLAVMRTTVDVVANDPASTQDDFQEMAADIRAAVDRAEQLCSALLILARNDRGLAVREQVDLATVAEDALDAADLGDMSVHAALEPAAITGDPVLTERLIANLLDNAARYNSDAGDIWITTDAASRSARLTVANTGPLLSAADAERIFQPFQRLNDRTSHSGFGLGLALVASIVEVHGGRVTATPRERGGLVVSVTIPLASPCAEGQEPPRDSDLSTPPAGQGA